jgi:hypothetical protein
MRSRSWGRAVRVLTVVAVFAVVGCGAEPTTSIKDELSEQEKQQIKELNEQRQDEWGRKRK